MKTEILHDENDVILELSVLRLTSRGKMLVMTVYEKQREHGMVTWDVFGGWRAEIAKEPCARATEKAMQRFRDAHIEEAWAVVRARVAVLRDEWVARSDGSVFGTLTTGGGA